MMPEVEALRVAAREAMDHLHETYSGSLKQGCDLSGPWSGPCPVVTKLDKALAALDTEEARLARPAEEREPCEHLPVEVRVHIRDASWCRKCGAFFSSGVVGGGYQWRSPERTVVAPPREAEAPREGLERTAELLLNAMAAAARGEGTEDARAADVDMRAGDLKRALSAARSGREGARHCEGCKGLVCYENRYDGRDDVQCSGVLPARDSDKRAVGTLFVRHAEDGPIDGATWINERLADLPDGEYHIFIGGSAPGIPPARRGHRHGGSVCHAEGCAGDAQKESK